MGRATEMLGGLPRSPGLTCGRKTRSQKPQPSLPPAAKTKMIENDLHIERAGLFDFIDNNNILAPLITSSN